MCSDMVTKSKYLENFRIVYYMEESECGREGWRVEGEWGEIYNTFLSKQLEWEGFFKKKRKKEKNQVNTI